MSSMRLLRLQSDYDAVRRLARLHPRIEVEGVSGDPPDRYRIVLHVRSLREQAGGIETVDRHRLEVTLPSTYPRDAPLCRMLTPVFHPNIAPHAVCIGDHWTAAESLDLLIQRVGEMLAYQSYNTKSPLNGHAARWAEEHLERLPVDEREFFMELAPADEGAAPSAGCSNCGVEASDFDVCAQGHRVCATCRSICACCGQMLCLCCGELTCPRCAPRSCANCGGTASTEPCTNAHALCADCSTSCPRCGRALCLACGELACPACVRREAAPAPG